MKCVHNLGMKLGFCGNWKSSNYLFHSDFIWIANCAETKQDFN